MGDVPLSGRITGAEMFFSELTVTVTAKKINK